MDPEALQRLLDPVQHLRHGIAGTLRELRDVLAAVAVLRRLLATPHRLHRGMKALHLRPRVVVVVLALDLVACEGEQPRHRVAVRAVARSRDGQRAGRVCGDHLDLHALGSLRGARPVRVVRGEDVGQRGSEPGVGDVQVHEAGACRLGGGGEPLFDGTRRDLGRDVPRRAALRRG